MTIAHVEELSRPDGPGNDYQYPRTTPGGYARPEYAVVNNDGIYGLFLADGDTFPYDEWLLWGRDTPENRRELGRAGVPIEYPDSEHCEPVIFNCDGETYVAIKREGVFLYSKAGVGEWRTVLGDLRNPSVPQSFRNALSRAHVKMIAG